MIRLKTLHTTEPLTLSYTHPDSKWGLGVLAFPSGLSLSLRYFRSMRDNPKCAAEIIVDTEEEREQVIQSVGLAADERGVAFNTEEPCPEKKRRGRPPGRKSKSRFSSS